MEVALVSADNNYAHEIATNKIHWNEIMGLGGANFEGAVAQW